MIAWLQKLIGGWLPIGTKPFPEWAGKILWAIGIYLMCTFALTKLFPDRPNVINVSDGGIVQQGEPRDLMSVGCNMWRGYIKAGVKSK